MCGILGVVSSRPNSNKTINTILKTLFMLSQLRGSQASGFAYTSNQRIIVHRAPVSGENIVHTNEYTSMIRSLACSRDGFGCIGHTRLATNGTQDRDDNNQPVIGKNSVLVHNGIILNTKQIWKTLKKHSDCPKLDSLVISSLFDTLCGSNGKNDLLTLHKLLKLIRGEASIALITKHSSSLLLATNTGSLYYSVCNNGTFIFSSEEFITKKAISIIDTKAEIKQLKPNTTLTIQINAHPHNKSIVRASKPTVFSISSDLYLNSLSLLQTHVPNYFAIQNIPRCSKCILPATMPLIRFNKHGVCNYCETYESQHPLGMSTLKRVTESYRLPNGRADCIVALSGGRDSSFVLHFAKKVLGLNPIAYTYDWGMVTDVARRNQSRLVSSLGVEHIWVSADIQYKRRNIKKNVEAWLSKPDIAMVPLFMAGDKQAEFYIEQLKQRTGIKLLLYGRGNQLEDERFKFGYYGIFNGTPKGVLHNLSTMGKLKLAQYFITSCVTNPKYLNSSLVDTAFAYAASYLQPHNDFTYLWHYIPWNEYKIVSTIKKLYGWESAEDTISTWRIDDGTPPFYNYIYYQIQGFTEHDGLRSNQIREGHITRKKAIELITEENKPRYESLKWYFDTLKINGHEALTVIDSMKKFYPTVRESTRMG